MTTSTSPTSSKTRTTRALGLVTAGLLGAAALTACGSDDARTVGGVDAGALTPAPASSAPGEQATSSAAQPTTAVGALQVLEGALQREDDTDDDADDDGADDRYDDFSVNGVDVDFGPSGWIATAGPLQDYDGDGTAEPFAAELDGLVGQQVSLQARDDDDNDDADDAGDSLDDADVYEVNGLALRGVSGPAPWDGGQAPTGPLAG